MSEEIFKDLVRQHDESISEATYNLPELSDYAKDPEFSKFSFEEIAKRRELDWQSKIDTELMERRLLKANGDWSDYRDLAKPSVLLKDALRKLEMITDSHLDSDEFLTDFDSQENAKKINSKIYKIKKAMGL